MHNRSDGLRLLLLSSSFCLLLGCASTKIGEPVISSSLDDLPRPTELLVYPFDVDENEVLADSFGPGLLTGDGEPSSRVELAEDVQRGFQFAFVMALRDKGIKARRAMPSTKPRRDSLQVLGEFVTIDEGDMMGRTVIGFGRGNSALGLTFRVYLMSENGPKQLLENHAEASGRKGPGMFIPVAGGAAVGNAIRSVAMSGVMQVVGESSGRLQGDIDRLADELAERALQFYIDQGWLKPN